MKIHKTKSISVTTYMNLEHKSKYFSPAFVSVFFHSDGRRVHNTDTMSNLQFYKLQTALDNLVETGKAAVPRWITLLRLEKQQ